MTTSTEDGMNCDDVQGLLDAFVDGELSMRDRVAVGRHVEGCESCARDVAHARALSDQLRNLGRHPLPDSIRGRIEAIVQSDAQHRTSSLWRVGWPSHGSAPALLVSHAIAVLVGALAVIAWLQARPEDSRSVGTREIASAHVRGLVHDQFQTVESGNPHTVRPWFAGKIGFAPRVVDLADAGFPLQGGRVDQLFGHPAAALSYTRRNHRITLFVAPRDADQRVSVGAAGRVDGELGYHLVGWHDSEFAYWAVSDLNRGELATFVDLLRAGLGRAGARPPG